MNIAVIGTGYVGLVTGTCFAENGNNVVCVDIDNSKIEKLKSGQITIFEPGLEKIFLRNLKEGRLQFSNSISSVIDQQEIIFLALPTPPGADGSADLQYILDVADKLGRIISGYKVIVNKSTVPVGTAHKVRKAISKHYRGDFDVVSNPEFLREGVAVNDFMKPDRVVVGTKSERARKLMNELYAPFLRQGNPIIFMDESSSELTKYAANSFLATKISFINEISQLCERFGADVDLVRIGMGTDERIGRRFLFPGIGYGGSCFPKDVKALIKSSNEVGYDFAILKAVEKVNEIQKSHLVEKIKSFYHGEIEGKHFAIWGLSFKPNTDDVREAPALVIIDALLNLGATICAYDPEAIENVKRELGNKINFSHCQYEALRNADGLIIATEWGEFRTPDFERIRQSLIQKVIFDGRNLYDIEMVKQAGFSYISVGRRLV